MRKSNNLLLGKRGEDIAADYLKRKGYTIIEKNIKKRHGDIDIVARKEKTLVFVEVKTRTSNDYGGPVEAITPWKLRSLIRSVQYYQEVRNLSEVSMRIDLVSVMLVDDRQPEIRHFENITS